MSFSDAYLRFYLVKVDDFRCCRGKWHDAHTENWHSKRCSIHGFSRSYWLFYCHWRAASPFADNLSAIVMLSRLQARSLLAARRVVNARTFPVVDRARHLTTGTHIGRSCLGAKDPCMKIYSCILVYPWLICLCGHISGQHFWICKIRTCENASLRLAIISSMWTHPFCSNHWW